MALSVRKMHLVSTGSGNAMTEILIADHADEKLAVESLRIRVRIPLREINVRQAERAAMRRAEKICGDIESCLTSAAFDESPGMPRDRTGAIPAPGSHPNTTDIRSKE